MTNEQIVEQIARAIGDAPYPPQLHVMGRAHKMDMARAILPIILAAREEGARAMQMESAKCAQTTHTMTIHGRKCNCVTCELNETEADILALDPAKIAGGSDDL